MEIVQIKGNFNESIKVMEKTMEDNYIVSTSQVAMTLRNTGLAD